MSIEKNQPTNEPVETTESNAGELSKEEAENTTGGIHKGGIWEGGEGGDHGDGGKGQKYF